MMFSNGKPRRVVITGLGLVTPLGCGVEASWERLLAGGSGARRVEEFDVSDLSCQVACFIPRGRQVQSR
jgi:3-oxoacyl-[acyl-carrier-protein] synthase II